MALSNQAQRLGVAIGVSFCVTAGSVLARFADGVVPVEYMIRPLLWTVPVAGLVGTVSLAAGRGTIPLAAVGSLAFVAANWWTLGAYLGLIIAITLIDRFKPSLSLDGAAIAASVVFLAAGLVAAAPHLELSGSVARAIEPEVEDDPVYLVLLDGYARADTLAQLGVMDNTGFVSDLEDRGFDHYADARTAHTSTHKTLTAIFAPGVDPTSLTKRQLRESWQLPEGFVAIWPPFGHITIPRTPATQLNSINHFDIAVLGASALGRLPITGEFVMDQWRSRLDATFDLIASIEATHVFAHILAPHTPYTYGDQGEPLGPRGCWPDCSFTQSPHPDHNGVVGSITYLNGKVIEMVDEIIAKRPEATIVLFSDHGGRFLEADPDEPHRAFLAARTPGQPGLLASDPSPDAILPALGLLPSR